jgi:hypothetical protein
MSNLLKYTGGSIEKTWDGSTDADLTRDVSGYYTSATVDLHGHIISKDAMLTAIEDFKQWGTIRLMHEDPIGKMKSIGVPDWNHIEASVTRTPQGDSVLTMVQEGIYKAFSVGLLVNAVDFVDFSDIGYEEFNGLSPTMVEYLKELGYVIKITGLTLIEVSIVDRPANPLARMQSVSKMIDGEVSVLPSVTQQDAIGMIENAIGVKSVFHMNKSGLLIPNNAKEASNMERIMENETEVVETVQDTAPEEDTATTVDSTETVDKGADVSAFLSRFEKAIDTIDQINASITALSESVSKNTFDPESTAQAIAKHLGESFFKSEQVASEVVAEVVEEAVNDTVAVDKATLDVLAKAITDKVVENLAAERQERKGQVNAPEPTEKVETSNAVDFKSMDKKSLKSHIVKSISESL